MIAKLVDCYVKKIDKFLVEEGYQPIDSLFFVKSGSFWCSFSGCEYFCKSGDFIIFDKHTKFSRKVTKQLEFLYIKFSPINESAFNVKSAPPQKATDRVLDDLISIEKNCADLSEIGFKTRNHYLNDILLSLCQINRSSAVSVSLVTSEYSSYIHANLSEKLDVTSIANHFGVSVSSLESKFVSATGKSVREYVIFARMQKAVQLLCETDYPISDVAFKCGYDNQFYFCNAFKKFYMISPSIYRAQNRNLV